MKEKFLNWVTERTTWMAAGAAVVFVLGTLQQAGYVDEIWLQIASGVLAIFGGFASDRQLPGGSK